MRIVAEENTREKKTVADVIGHGAGAGMLAMIGDRTTTVARTGIGREAGIETTVIISNAGMTTIEAQGSAATVALGTIAGSEAVEVVRTGAIMVDGITGIRARTVIVIVAVTGTEVALETETVTETLIWTLPQNGDVCVH